MSKKKWKIGIPKHYLAVVAVLAAIMMGVLDGTVMNVALPTLSTEFGVSASEVIWVVNAYQLVVTMCLLGFAAVGDVFGYRRVFLVGVSVFVFASIMCAVSTSFEMLVAARVLQGIGGACTLSINTALLRLIFPPSRLGRVMGANAVIVAVTAASGPALGGAILSVGHWSWIFLMNVPLGLAALFIGWHLLPHNPPSEKVRKLDGQSVVMNAVFFGLLIYTVEGVAHNGVSTLLLLQGVVAVIVGVVYVRRQLSIDMPILPVDLFRIPIFTLSIACSISCFTSQMLALVSLPFFMQHGLGMTVAETGVLMTPWPLATMLTDDGTTLTSHDSPMGSSSAGSPFQGFSPRPPHTTGCRFGRNSKGYNSVFSMILSLQLFDGAAAGGPLFRGQRYVISVERANFARLFLFYRYSPLPPYRFSS